MTEILIAIVNMSIAASIVAIAVILVRFPLKKAPKVFSYVLWAAVFLRLICPFNFESPASLMPTQTEVISPTILTNSGVSVIDEPVNLFLEATLPQVDTATSVNPVQVALTISAYAWLCGVVLIVFYGIISYIGVKRRVYDATLIQDNIFETDKISTAFVLGFIKPKIYLPTIVKGRQFDYILKHEQVHIQRRDYLIKPLAFFVLALHWFNPIVWLSYYFMSKDMEMSCDEAVLRKSNEDIRQDYSTSLVSLYTKKIGLLSPLAFGEGSYKNMKARIKNVLNFKKTPRWAIIVCSIMVVLFMAGFTTNPPRGLSADNLVNGSIFKTKPTDNTSYSAQGTPAFDYFQNNSIQKFLAMWVKEATGIENPKWNYDSFAKYDILDSNGVSASGEDLYYCAFSADNDRYGYIIVSYYEDDPSIQNKGVVETPYLYDLQVNSESISAPLTTRQNDKSERKYISRTDSLIQDFEKYKSFGVIYNAEQDAVFYNGKRVRLFVDFKSSKVDNMTYAFDLCYQDSRAGTTLYLEAVKDNAGKITGIRHLNEQTAQDILESLNGTSSHSNKIDKENPPNDSTLLLTYDATQIIDQYGIVATDNFNNGIPQNITKWIAQCDQKQGAYLLKTKLSDKYTTYVYYNGGRYPWVMNADAETININLYSNTNLATSTSHYLMCFTSPKDYAGINLYLDGVKLNYKLNNQLNASALTEATTAQKTEQNIKSQYAIYEQYGLTYRANEDKLYYKDQIVRYFIDKYNNGQGVLNMWGYDLDGTIDLHTIRNNVGLQGELIGIEAFSQKDFNLRTKEIEAEKNNIPNYDVLTFRFRKSEAPESLQLWIKQCEDDVFDFSTTEQNGRYYIYVRGETEFNFGVKVDGDKANMEISPVNGVKGEGYALFSAPLYKQFTVTYNGATRSFIQ